MITIPTHKCHKSPFKHSKTFSGFTSGRRVIVTVQIHSRKNLLKGLKRPLQNGPLMPESSRIGTILLQDPTKRGVCHCGGGDALRCLTVRNFLLPPGVGSGSSLGWGLKAICLSDDLVCYEDEGGSTNISAFHPC
jgi:hypothetical protein